MHVKKLDRIGRRGPGSTVTGAATQGIGREFVHVCVDAATRIAYVEV